MTVTVSSRDNHYIKEFIKLKRSRRYRDKRLQLAVEGPNLVREALRAGFEAEVLFFTEAYYSRYASRILNRATGAVRVLLVNEQLFHLITDTNTPQEVAAIFNYPDDTPGTIKEMIPAPAVILDQLQDPGNMGTIIRTAAAAGFKAAFYTPGSTDPYGPKSLRATAGAIFHLKPGQVQNPGELFHDLNQKGVQIIAASAGSGLDYRSADFSPPTALIIGNESRGVSGELLAKVDYEVTIPLEAGVESLNAAVAAGILLFEIMRSRK